MRYATLLAAASLLLTATNRPDAGKAGDKADAFKSKGEIDISGYYACSGKEGPGKTYNGVAVISKKRDIYVVQWTVGVGAAFFGIGIRDGNTLSCSWAIPGDKGVVRGINVYHIESGPRLVGRWTSFPGDGSIKTETLTFLRKLGDE